MDNHIDIYLNFKAYNAFLWVQTMAKHYDEDLEISKKVKDVIYDYLNEVLLGEDYASDDELFNVTGVKGERDVTSFIKLLIEYGIVTRKMLKEDNIYKSYLFIVDATMYSIRIFNDKNSMSGEIAFDEIIKKVMREGTYYNFDVLKDIVQKSSKELEHIFQIFVKKERIMNEAFDSKNYNIEYLKITNSMFLADIVYQNEELLNYEEREVSFVKKNYDFDIYIQGLKELLFDYIQQLLAGNRFKLFVKIPNNILSKKSVLKIITNMLHIFSIRKNIVVVIDFSAFLKDETIMSYLTSLDFIVAINKDCEFPKSFDLETAKYLMIDYFDDDEFKRIYKRTKDNLNLIITNHVTKSERQKCNDQGITYFLKSR